MVAEENDGALGDEESELVLLGVAELGELEADDLGANVLGEVDDLLGRREQRLLVGVGARSRITEVACTGANGRGELEVGGALCTRQ